MSEITSHAKVVIIGGGVVGCSIAYHLAKLGWKDTLLIERHELTSGSSWHAAGVIHTINSDPNIARLQEYTLKLYDEIEELTGQDCGIHRPGGIYLASTPERMDYLKQERAKARYMGLDTDFISLKEAVDLNPLINPDKYIGALFEPLDGHVDPSGVTFAYAKAAKYYGASVINFCPVLETNPQTDGTWEVVTEKGTVKAEYVINAAGLWAREVGQLAGIDLPVQPMEHHYLITEAIPEIVNHDKEIAVTVDYEGNAYTRQEHDGLLIGTYESPCQPWAIDGTPLDFGHELLQPDLERIAERLETAFDRMPALAEAGIKTELNGPFTFGPDGNPLIGPVPGLKNYWVAVGVMAGFCQGGGVGLCMAEWMIHGEPSIDTWAMDVARFGKFATRDYGREKSAENYTRRFLIAYPNEVLPVGRQQKTTSLYEPLRAKGAFFGVSFGLEHALWFSPDTIDPEENPTFRRSNAFEHVANEVKMVREGVGALEIANFGKHKISGPGAEVFLDKLMANKLPKTGRLTLSPMLTPKGRLAGDLTIAKIDDETYYILGSGVAQEYHRRWFEKHLPKAGVSYENASDRLHGIALAGPKSRELMSRLTRSDVSAEGMRFLDIRHMDVGLVPCMVARVSFTGELGYEIYCEPQYQRAVYNAIEKEGSDLGLGWFGSYALMSMRLEKSWGVWTLDFRPDFTALEAGLDFFVNLNKPVDFIGKQVAIEEEVQGPEKRMIALKLKNTDVDALHDEPVFHKGECVGYVTSGGYGHSVKESIALAYLPTKLAESENEFEVEILGELVKAEKMNEPLYDPSGKKMRA
jgi:dimethylglycine dehydrogenase